jgi:Ca-activated chloride channel family protein
MLLINKTSNAPVPLQRVSVQASIRSFVADLIVEQEFKNSESTAIEAVYVFPLEESSAVYSMSATIGDKTVVATIRERKEAQKEYVDALAQGHGAYLMEQDDTNREKFILSVGALPPNTSCTIRLQLAVELDATNQGKSIRFVLPTAIAPRYSSGKETPSVSPAPEITYTSKSPYRLEFQASIHVDFLKGSPAASFGVSSPSHPLSQTFDSDKRVVNISLAQQSVALDRDVIVDVNYGASEGEVQILSLRERNSLNSSSAALVSIAAPTPSASAMSMLPIQSTVIFLVDCSGSMDSENKIGLARDALRLFVKAIPPGTNFNILKFGSSYVALFPEPQGRPYTAETAAAADALVDQLAANLGGTELSAALDFILSKPGYSRDVLLLTDGEVGNTNDVIRQCSAAKAYARVFSLGVGSSPSRSLVKGVARVTSGRAVFVPPHCVVDEPVADVLDAVLRPRLANIQVHWPTGTKVVAASNSAVATCVSGDRVLVYAVLSHDTPFGNTNGEDPVVRVSYTDVNGQQVEKSVPMRLSNAASESKEEVSALSAMTGSRAIAALFDTKYVEPTANNTGSTQSRFKDLAAESNGAPARKQTEKEWEEERKAKVIALSLAHHVLSPYTALVAVEHRKDGSNADMQLREVPVMMSAGEPFYAPPPPPGIGQCSGTAIRRVAAPMSHLMAMGGAPAPAMCFAAASPCPPPPQPTASRSVVMEKSVSKRKGSAPHRGMADKKMMQRDEDEDADDGSVGMALFGDGGDAHVNSNTNHMQKEMEVQEELARKPSKPQSTGLRGLIALQKFDGSWEPTAQWEAEAGSTVADVQQRIAGSEFAQHPWAQEASVLATALVCALFRSRWVADERLWKPVQAKAMRWLMSKIASDVLVERLIAALQ